MTKIPEQGAQADLYDPELFCVFVHKHYGLMVSPAHMRRAGIVNMSIQQWTWFRLQWT